MKTNGISLAFLIFSIGCTPAYVEIMQNEDNFSELNRFECTVYRADISLEGVSMIWDFDNNRMTGSSGNSSNTVYMNDSDAAEIRKEFGLDEPLVYVRYPDVIVNEFRGTQLRYDYSLKGDMLFFGDTAANSASIGGQSVSGISAASINLKSRELKSRGFFNFDGTNASGEFFARCI